MWDLGDPGDVAVQDRHKAVPVPCRDCPDLCSPGWKMQGLGDPRQALHYQVWDKMFGLLLSSVACLHPLPPVILRPLASPSLLPPLLGPHITWLRWDREAS